MSNKLTPHEFLERFIPLVREKSKQLNKASWLLETTGLKDAADLKADLDAELRILFSDKKTYEDLLAWDKDPSIKDPVMKRELSVLIRTFIPNLLPKKEIEEISSKEAILAQSYGTFRPTFEGSSISENGIREILKNEEDPHRRKKAWEASKEIGEFLAPQILALVKLRNQVAKKMGYPDYFEMQLALQEVDSKWLTDVFDDLGERTDQAYSEMLGELHDSQAKRFHVAKEELGPWSFGDPFCQEDPLDCKELDALVDGVDLIQVSKDFYTRMGIDVQGVLDHSDMFERPGKNQHAFCVNIDRNKDVRTLNNVKSSIKWLETVLHEFGHAIYELGYDEKLPWLLREPPHMITTEAMALIAGRQAYRFTALKGLLGDHKEKIPLMKKADQSLRRRQLIFSRWVLVMTKFERELYRDPSQDLNALWWSLVQKYQKINPPKGREGKADWAAKIHIGLAPVYYFSYLLGEMFASAIEDVLEEKFGSRDLDKVVVGKFLEDKLFFPGNRMRWDQLVIHVTSSPLTAHAWIRQFAGLEAITKS